MLGLASDLGAQLTALAAGWRFYKRAVEKQLGVTQALQEWVEAAESALDLGADPAALSHFAAPLDEVSGIVDDEDLQARIRTLAATITKVR